MHVARSRSGILPPTTHKQEGLLMPKSKPRRKPGGKAVTHPGRGLPSKRLILPPRQSLEEFFAENPGAIANMERLRQTIADPQLPFVEKVHAAVAWDDPKDMQPVTRSDDDLDELAVFLCSDLDDHDAGKHLVIPSEEWRINQIADLLRPYCPGPTFIEAWRTEKGWDIERIQDILAQ
jgi:hypothetical protein